MSGHGRARKAARGFTLVEILVALAIVSISILVLVRANATALTMTQEAERMTQATLLAQGLMNRALAVTDIYGFGENDVQDHGDFEQLYPGEYPGWTWEWTLAKTRVELPDLSGFMDDAGVDENQQQAVAQGGLGALGIDPSMIDDTVGRFLREVRVKVCYPTGPESDDCVELVSHVVNPGGRVVGAEDQAVLLDRMGAGRMPDILEEED